MLLSLTCVSHESNTFTDLQTAIDELGNELNINHNYVYNAHCRRQIFWGNYNNNRELVMIEWYKQKDGSNAIL